MRRFVFHLQRGEQRATKAVGDASKSTAFIRVNLFGRNLIVVLKRCGYCLCTVQTTTKSHKGGLNSVFIIKGQVVKSLYKIFYVMSCCQGIGII